MLILLIILTFLAIYLGGKAADNGYDGLTLFSLIGALILGMCCLTMCGYIIYFMANGLIASDKIKMYQEENTQIQESIDTIVMKYMNYEKDTLKEFKVESPVTYVSLYPQLQSDELVKRQIDVYIANNNKIKELKEQELEMKIGKWLLYFG